MCLYIPPMFSTEFQISLAAMPSPWPTRKGHISRSRARFGVGYVVGSFRYGLDSFKHGLASLIYMGLIA